jgi:hypothetical protein
LRPNLERWASLEPERCRLTTDLCQVAWKPNDFPPEGSGWNLPRLLLGEADSRYFLADLQVAVQEAIEARGWGWDIEYLPGFHDPDDSEPVPPLRIARVWTPTRPEEAVSSLSTASESLLSAYLTALEDDRKTT